MFSLSIDLARTIVEDFLKSSRSCAETIVRELARFKGDERRKIPLFYLENGRRNEIVVDGGHFFLRSSFEYSNPQLTVEEVQGIVALRMLEVCGNYFSFHNFHESNLRANKSTRIRTFRYIAVSPCRLCR